MINNNNIKTTIPFSLMPLLSDALLSTKQTQAIKPKKLITLSKGHEMTASIYLLNNLINFKSPLL